MYRFGLLRYPLWWVELLIGRWKFFGRQVLHEKWYDETPYLCCGFLDTAGWRLAQIYILISGRRLACLQGGSEFVCRIRLMNLFSARFAISACGQLQQYLQQWFYCNQCRCIYNSFLLMYLYYVLLVQQLFTDECILSYLFFYGILQLSSKGGVKIWPCDLYRLFGEDIALCQLFVQSNDHFTSVCSFNDHVLLFS